MPCLVGVLDQQDATVLKLLPRSSDDVVAQ